MTWLRVLRLCVLAVALAASAAPGPSPTLEPLRGLTWTRDHQGLAGSLPAAPALQVSRLRRPLALRGGDPLPSAQRGDVASPYPVVLPSPGPGVTPPRRPLLGTYATTLPPPTLS